MTKVDERSRVPVIGESERRRLAAALDRPGVVAGDRGVRVPLETRALLEYLDTAPLRNLAALSVQRRFEDGSFGRP